MQIQIEQTIFNSKSILIFIKKLTIKLTIILGLIHSLTHVASAHVIENFNEAKKHARNIWSTHRYTFYCRCPYDKHGIIHYQKCSYEPKNRRKAKRMNWEHIVPVSWYGQHLECWQKPMCTSSQGNQYKGRNCCRKISATFRQMEADLHNLVPAVPEVNQARSNYHFTEFHLGDSAAKHYFRGCSLIIDERYRLIEPNAMLKGTIARAHLYMAQEYGIDLTPYEQKLFSSWHQHYPASHWEKKWNQQVAKIQGNENAFIH